MLALAPRLNQAEFRISCRVLYRVPANGAAKTAASDGGGGAALSGVVQGPSPLTTSPAELLSFYPGADREPTAAVATQNRLCRSPDYSCRDIEGLKNSSCATWRSSNDANPRTIRIATLSFRSSVWACSMNRSCTPRA